MNDEHSFNKQDDNINTSLSTCTSTSLILKS